MILAATVCIFAYQSGLVQDVPLSDVHLYRQAVIVPCHWTFEKAQAFWWSETDSEEHMLPLPPAKLPEPPK